MRIIDDKLRYNPNSLRLKGYDYSQPGAYFVTICTCAQICFFGEVKDGTVVLNKYREVARSCWDEIPLHFPEVTQNHFIVMPNHVHGIIIISPQLPSVIPNVETRHAVSKKNVPPNTNESFQKPVPSSLPTIIRPFKSAVTKRLNGLAENLPATIWQRSYYEHIIRSEKEFNQIVDYINFNPYNWEMDEENPQNIDGVAIPGHSMIRKEKLHV